MMIIPKHTFKCPCCGRSLVLAIALLPKEGAFAEFMDTIGKYDVNVSAPIEDWNLPGPTENLVRTLEEMERQSQEAESKRAPGDVDEFMATLAAMVAEKAQQEPVSSQRCYAHEVTAPPWAANSASPATPQRENSAGWEYYRPGRPASMESDTWVPLAQSGITGGIAALSLGTLLLLLGAEWKTTLVWVAIAFISGVVLVWVWKLWLHAEALIEYFRADNDQPQEQPRPPSVVIEVASEDQRQRKIWHVPDGIDHSTLAQFCRAALRGQTLAVTRWVGRGRPFTRRQYEELMGYMERAGWVENTGSNVGRVLTPAGRRVCAGILESLQGQR
jgi:hypothetical protein